MILIMIKKDHCLFGPIVMWADASADGVSMTVRLVRTCLLVYCELNCKTNVRFTVLRFIAYLNWYIKTRIGRNLFMCTVACQHPTT